MCKHMADFVLMSTEAILMYYYLLVMVSYMGKLSMHGILG